MTVLLPILFGIMLLTEPEESVIDQVTADRIAQEADAGVAAGRRSLVDASKGARITARRSDFDREEGVVMFEGDVVVNYAADYTMCSDRVFVFVDGANELSRIVATGGVSITNELRTGVCARARFLKGSSEIEMYGEGSELASLVDGAGGNVIKGSLIRFWIDSEQVEVVDSELKVSKGQKGVLKL